MPPTSDETPELTDETEQKIIDCIESYDGAAVDTRELPVQVTDHTTGSLGDGTPADVLEVQVDVVGRLDLDEVMDTQGRLMYVKNGIEIMLIGFEDRHVLLEVKRERDDGDGDAA